MSIDLLSTQALFSHIAFLFLFILMIGYWFGAMYSWSDTYGTLATYTMFFVNASVFFVLLLRWIINGHYPLSNLYESLLFLGWSITTLHLLLEKMTGFAFIGAVTTPLALFILGFATFSLPIDLQGSQPLVPALQSHWLLMHVTTMLISYAALLAGSLFAISFLVIGESDPQSKLSRLENNSILASTAQQSKSLPLLSLPSKSASRVQLWLSNVIRKVVTNPQIFQFELHNEKVLAFAEKDAKILRIDLATSQAKQRVSMNSSTEVGITRPSSYNQNLDEQETMSLRPAQRWLNWQVTAKRSMSDALDQLSYRTLGIGFAFLTVGILSGAVWANEAWGSYWSWDPKETWAFITWIIFALYLHLRITQGWSGKKPAIMASIGFLIIWICYLGVNLLGKGLHSYGWLS